MDILFYVFAGATGVAAALAAIAIWAPRPTWVRVVALCIAALFIPVVYNNAQADPRRADDHPAGRQDDIGEMWEQ